MSSYNLVCLKMKLAELAEGARVFRKREAKVLRQYRKLLQAPQANLAHLQDRWDEYRRLQEHRKGEPSKNGNKGIAGEARLTQLAYAYLRDLPSDHAEDTPCTPLTSAQIDKLRGMIFRFARIVEPNIPVSGTDLDRWIQRHYERCLAFQDMRNKKRLVKGERTIARKKARQEAEQAA